MSTKPYNRIVLVGNGFDMALGLDSSYKSFVDWLLRKGVADLLTKGRFESNLFSIEVNSALDFSIKKNEIIESLPGMSSYEMFDIISEFTETSFKFDFFEEIIKRVGVDRWVDIEELYFETLNLRYKSYMKSPLINSRWSEILNLNTCMDYLTSELHSFIKVQLTNKRIDYSSSKLESLLVKCFESLRSSRASLVSRHGRSSNPDNVIFLNFNYTNTLRLIADNNFDSSNVTHIHIHGAVDDIKNPIIFGYGDDTNEDYTALELSGQNELLRKIKSFQYPRTNNYHKLLNFLGAEEYDVFIVGHSCGLSDRTMLKTIFEHPNCLAIQNFHYLGESEDFDKRMQISRHFTNKVLMRERLLSYDELAIIPQDK